MISRRRWLDLSLRTGASLVLAPGLLRALEKSGGKLIQRAVPSSGEMLPVISFGPRQSDGAAMKEVLKALADNGGKVVDVLHGGPEAEKGIHTAANELGLQTKFFWTTPLSVSVPLLPGYTGPEPKIDAAAVRAAMEEKFATFKVKKIDLVMVGAGSDMSTHFSVLRELKKEGRIRYIGVHDLAPPAFVQTSAPFARLEEAMRSEQIDFVGTDYSVGDRRVEETLLPLAQERKVGFLAYFPFDRRRIFARASSTPLPEWAAEFDAKTWAQFFLKYVISHPAVTMARVGTTKAEHLLDNLGGGVGRLPDEAMRKRMAELVDDLPPTPPPGKPQPQQQPPKEPSIELSADILDRYVGEYEYKAVGTLVTFRRDGDSLLVKVSGNMPEGPLVPRSETRFGTAWGANIEFQLDGKGKVTGAMVEQGPYRIPLAPK